MAEPVLKCPNTECGIILRERGIEMFNVIFPATFDSVKNLLSGNINKAKCPSCSTIVEFDPMVCFVHIPLEKAWIYVPRVVLASVPDMMDRMTQKIESLGDAIEGSWTTVPVESLEELSKEAVSLLRSRFAGVMNEFMLAELEGKDEEWLTQNQDELTFEFFTSLQLVIDEALPVYVQIAYSPAEGGEEGPGKSQLLEALVGYRTRLVRRKLITSALEFRDKEEFSLLPDTLERLVPRCVLDERQINDLAAAAAAMAKRKEISAPTQYIVEAVLAWAAHKASIPNPRASAWTSYVAEFEVVAATGEDWQKEVVSRLNLPDEFLINTLDFRHLWVEIVRRLNEYWLDKDLDAGKSQEYRAGAEKVVSPLFALAERLGWADTVSDVLQEAFLIRGLDEAAQPVVIQTFFDTARKHLDEEVGVSFFAKALQIAVNLGRIDLAADAFQDAIRRLGHDRLNDATRLVARYAQACNERSFNSEADRAISTWVESLKRARQWEDVKIYQRIDLLNEWGNTKRYKGHLRDSAALYEKALELCGADGSDYQRRILYKNLGIIYRDIGRYFEGVKYLNQSLEMTTSPPERATILQSLAICHIFLGDKLRALELVQEAHDILAGGKDEFFVRQRSLVLLTKMQILIELDRLSEASSICAELFDLAQNVLKDPVFTCQIAAASISILESEEGEDYTEVARLSKRIIETVLESGIPMQATLRIALLLRLARLALAEKDYQSFRRYIAKAEELPAEAVSRSAWRIRALKSRAAFREGDLRSAYSLAQEAWHSLVGAYNQADLHELPFSFEEDRETLQAQTGAIAWAMYKSGEAPASYLAHGAEMQGALMQNLAFCLDEDTFSFYAERSISVDATAEDIISLALESGHGRPVAFLQFLLADGEYHPLVTVCQDGNTQTSVIGVSLDRKLLSRATSEFRYAVETYNPSSSNNPLAHLPNWSEFSARLASALRGTVATGSHICVVPSRGLSLLPIHCCSQSAGGPPLISDYTFSYVPSIFVAARLREGLSKTRAPGWRPARFGNFVVWQAGDYSRVISSFSNHSAAMSRAAKGCDMQQAVGVDAHLKSLEGLLAGTELLHLCCHGVVGFNTGTHRLLISNGKTLPPSDRRALANPYNDPFFLDWDEIKTDSSPTIVISCSCSSGTTSVKTGGERIGFERSLFQRGTSSFIAPLWDVSVFDIHPLVENVVSDYFSSTDLDLSQVVQRAILSAIESGRPLHAVGALTLMGDWI